MAGKDAAVLRHQPHGLPWEFGTQDTGVTGLIPCFTGTHCTAAPPPSMSAVSEQRMGTRRGQSGSEMFPGNEDSAPRWHRDAGEGCTGDTVLSPRKIQTNTQATTLTSTFPQGGNSFEDWGNPTASLDFLGRLEDKKGTRLHSSL